jgi:hypothetical protein
MTNLGIHQDFNWSYYAPEEVKIIQKLKGVWYVTSSTPPLVIGRTSVYRALLMKPTDFYSEMFNLEREVITVFSSYAKFEARVVANRGENPRVTVWAKNVQRILSSRPTNESRARQLTCLHILV